MGFYQLRREMLVEKPLDEVWDFISSPANLKRITPDFMGFDIVSQNLPKKMYKGMIIEYRVKPLLNIPTRWVTEITQIEEKKFFIDEQRVGPYKLWHHQHFVEPLGENTQMIDIVSYSPPLGLLGNIANQVMIKQKLKGIFDYRTQALEEWVREKDLKKV